MSVARSSLGLIGMLPLAMAGMALSYFIVTLPPLTAIALTGGLILLAFSVLKIELPFMLTLLAVIFLCENGVPADNIFKPLEVIKITGVPEPMEMAVALLFVSFMIRLFLRRETISRYFAWPNLALCCVLGAGYYTGLSRGNDNIILRSDFKAFLLPMIFFFCSYNILDRFDKKKIQRILLVLFAAIMLKNLAGIASYLLGRGFLYEGHSRVVFLDTTDHILFVLVIVTIVSLIINNVLKGGKLLAASLSLLPLFFTELFSYRRNAWLGLLISLSILFLLLPMARKLKMIAVGGMTALALLMTLSAAMIFEKMPNEQFLAKRFTSIVDRNESSNMAHFNEYEVTIRETMKSPLLGLGLGGKHLPVPGYETLHTHIVHNTFLLLWMKMGIPALVFAGWLLYRYGQLGFKLSRSPMHQLSPIHLSLFSILGYFLVSMNVGPSVLYYRETCNMAFICGLVIILYKKSKPAGEQPRS